MAALTVSGLFVLSSPGTAEAASPCPGRKVRTLPFSTGSVQVFKRRGYVCAVTVAKKQGTRKWMSVSLRAWGGRPVVNEGWFKYRAGPVKVHAGRRCVWVEGEVGRGSVSSGWILC
ncbi:hypothetical protein [Streptomyces sp. NPDC002845]